MKHIFGDVERLYTTNSSFAVRTVTGICGELDKCLDYGMAAQLLHSYTNINNSDMLKEHKSILGE